MSKRIIVIAGPTASGKSTLALELAERLGGTVINADSMQIYRDLEILTARPDPAAVARAPHRLYGVLDGAELSSVASWIDLARAEIAMAKLPILCGGTGLYLRALLQGIAPVPPIPDPVRQAARALHAELGGEAFRAALGRIDPEAASRLNAGDSQRLVRAYEVVTATGRPLGDWQREAAAESDLDPLIFTLLPPREELYAAIDGRFAAMVRAGALDEVRALIARNLDPALPIMKALGVPELARHLAGAISLDAAIAEAQQASRRYAKRQYTWFRHQLPAAEIIEAKYYVNLTGLICQIICNSA
ncbi:MAG TPA: tRNA (adenosine(37)-N6)-dimethylallyltransferase MiaA [Aliidongia sp.]|nr:tRNA (adenosine(37)-N6)-dimethylallyltransferase MiaA [Aliidongia sp.]